MGQIPTEVSTPPHSSYHSPRGPDSEMSKQVTPTIIQLVALQLQRVRDFGLKYWPGIHCQSSSHLQQEHGGSSQEAY